jgi:hypothetical protein
MNYQLANAATRSRRHPSTFKIPSEHERANLLVGSQAKLIFEAPEGQEPRGERLWVRVTQVLGASALFRAYRGVLDDDPVAFHDVLKPGAVVEFGPDHVCDIEDLDD